MPCRASLKAMEKMPADDSPAAAVDTVETFHVRPRSVDLNTRASAAPPVPNQALLFPCAIRHVPLAAKAPSPVSAGGMFSRGTSLQVAPPSAVVMIRKWLLTGSLTATP